MRGFTQARIALTAALFAALAGCVETTPPTNHAEEPNQYSVTVAPVSHPVRFAAGAAALSADETARLAGFLRAQQVQRGELATLTAEPGPLGDQRRNRVAEALRRSGVRIDFVAAAVPMIDSVAVTLARSTVLLPQCPNWQELGTGEFFNTPSSNLGCATTTNLYVMVADPRDLVEGRTPGSVDAEPGMRAVQAYRTGKKADDSGKGGGAPSTASVAPITPGGSSNAQ